jgi:hypothetical protein
MQRSATRDRALYTPILAAILARSKDPHNSSGDSLLSPIDDRLDGNNARTAGCAVYEHAPSSTSFAFTLISNPLYPLQLCMAQSPDISM